MIHVNVGFLKKVTAIYAKVNNTSSSSANSADHVNHPRQVNLSQAFPSSYMKAKNKSSHILLYDLINPFFITLDLTTDKNFKRELSQSVLDLQT